MWITSIVSVLFEVLMFCDENGGMEYDTGEVIDLSIYRVLNSSFGG